MKKEKEKVAGYEIIRCQMNDLPVADTTSAASAARYYGHFVLAIIYSETANSTTTN